MATKQNKNSGTLLLTPSQKSRKSILKRRVDLGQGSFTIKYEGKGFRKVICKVGWSLIRDFSVTIILSSTNLSLFPVNSLAQM